MAKAPINEQDYTAPDVVNPNQAQVNAAAASLAAAEKLKAAANAATDPKVKAALLASAKTAEGQYASADASLTASKNLTEASAVKMPTITGAISPDLQKLLDEANAAVEAAKKSAAAATAAAANVPKIPTIPTVPTGGTGTTPPTVPVVPPTSPTPTKTYTASDGTTFTDEQAFATYEGALAGRYAANKASADAASAAASTAAYQKYQKDLNQREASSLVKDWLSSFFDPTNDAETIKSLMETINGSITADMPDRKSVV